MFPFDIDANRMMAEMSIKPEFRDRVKIAGCIACEELFAYGVDEPTTGMRPERCRLPEGDPERKTTPIVLFSPERCLCGDCRDKITPFIVRVTP